MKVYIALGLGAGIVSALLFSAAGTGSIPAVLLMYLAPLPVLIVALGWHQLLGLLALSSGAVVATMMMRPAAGTAFALGPAFCGWILAYVAAARLPAADPASRQKQVVELLPDRWFSVGWLLLLLGLLGAMVAFASLAAATGFDHASYREALEQAVSALVRREMRGGRPELPNASSFFGPDFVRLMVTVAPALLAGMLTVILAVNLWLAGRVVMISGRLPRPWPDIPAGRMPRAAIAIALAGAVMSRLPGFMGVAGMAIGGGVATAFALQGLALVHFVSRSRPGRGFILSGAYFLTIVLGYLFLPAFALLGVADTAWPLRRMFGGTGPPPLPPRPPFT